MWSVWAAQALQGNRLREGPPDPGNNSLGLRLGTGHFQQQRREWLTLGAGSVLSRLWAGVPRSPMASICPSPHHGHLRRLSLGDPGLGQDRGSHPASFGRHRQHIPRRALASQVNWNLIIWTHSHPTQRNSIQWHPLRAGLSCQTHKSHEQKPSQARRREALGTQVLQHQATRLACLLWFPAWRNINTTRKECLICTLTITLSF